MKVKFKKRRRNQGDGDTFPLGTFVEVEAIKINQDGTLQIVIADENMPASLSHPVGIENRKRRKNSKKKRKAKAKKKSNATRKRR